MKLFPFNILLLLFVCCYSSCSSNSEEEEEEIIVPTIELTGTDVFTYTDYSPLSNKPIKIYYHIPQNTTTNTPILFVFHGNNRNAEDYRNASIAKANEQGFIIIAPEFSNTSFPGGDAYNLANIFIDGDNPSSSTLVSEEEWTFSVIEPIFDFIQLRTNSTRTRYHIVGHSAGAQFAHRFVLFKPNARFDKVVVSAAGWFTVPDRSIDFPYGLKKSPQETIDFTTLFSKNIFIQVGELDNNPNASGLRRNQYADAQGLNRYDRSHHFFNTANTNAQNNNIFFNWSIQVNAGLDHSFAPAIEKAIDLLAN